MPLMFMDFLKMSPVGGSSRIVPKCKEASYLMDIFPILDLGYWISISNCVSVITSMVLMVLVLVLVSVTVTAMEVLMVGSLMVFDDGIGDDVGAGDGAGDGASVGDGDGGGA